jgi:hypothetical protein
MIGAYSPWHQSNLMLMMVHGHGHKSDYQMVATYQVRDGNLTHANALTNRCEGIGKAIRCWGLLVIL